MAKQNLSISIFVDNPNSWIHPYIAELKLAIESRGHSVRIFGVENDIEKGDILFILSCDKIVPESTLQKHRHNIVIHPSDLPLGQGFSPLTWQILEGKNDIPVTLFEAVAKVDSGPYYYKDTIHFQGHELNEELKQAQGQKTIELALKFIDAYPHNEPREQRGESTWYKKRKSKDSELDIHQTILQQFNLLRVVDNERYPAHFTHDGHTYILKIYKQGDTGQ